MTTLHLSYEWRRFIAYAVNQVFNLDELTDTVAGWASDLLIDLYTSEAIGGSGVIKALLKHIEVSGVAAPNLVANVWTQRPINATVDPWGLVDLANDEFAPVAGVYAIDIRAAQTVGALGHLRLYNVTQNTQVLVGDNMRATSGQESHAFLSDIITCNGSDYYRVDHETSVSQSIGMGIANSQGDQETYLVIELIPLSSA